MVRITIATPAGQARATATIHAACGGGTGRQWDGVEHATLADAYAAVDLMRFPGSRTALCLGCTAA